MALDPLLAVAHKRLNDEQRQQQDSKVTTQTNRIACTITPKRLLDAHYIICVSVVLQKRRLLSEKRAAPPTFLTAGDAGFEELISKAYVGLARYPAEQLTAEFAQSPLLAEAAAAATQAAATSSSSSVAAAASPAAPFDLHSALQRDCFGRLLREGLFFRDVIQVGSNDAGGGAATATSGRPPRFHYVRTRVQRCLVGDAGMTYRYSGVRLFAHPWNAQQEQEATHEAATARTKADVDSALPPAIAPSLRLLSALNSHLRSIAEDRLKALAQEMAAADAAPAADAAAASSIATAASAAASASLPAASLPAPSVFGAAFNLVLLNYLDPSTHALPLRPEPYYSMGPMAVGWHRDESLHPLSTIAVYHSSEENQPASRAKSSAEDEDETKEQPSNGSRGSGSLWSIALKRAWDIVTPAIQVPLRSGDSYLMLHALNTTHQHAVLAGDHRRFSSTHRSAITEGQTIDGIQRRCEEALEHNWSGDAAHIPRTVSAAHAYLVRLSELLSAASDAEFEWIRQFWLQGARHAQMHAYWWRPRIERLEAQWRKMQQAIAEVYQTLGQYGFSQLLVNDTAETAPTAAPAAAVVAPADAAASTPLVALDVPICRMLLTSLTQTSVLRSQWSNRVRQEAYHPKPAQRDPSRTGGASGASSSTFEDAPIVRPEFGEDAPLPFDLSAHIAELQQWLPEFEQRQWSGME